MEARHDPQAKHSFPRLSAFAAFLLQRKLHAYAAAQLQVAREMQLSLFKHFASFNEEQLMAIGMKTATDFLTPLAAGRIEEQIAESNRRWKANILPVVTREQVEAEDITEVQRMRRAVFLRFIPDFTGNLNDALSLVAEIDAYAQLADTAAIRTFVEIQQEQVGQYRDQLLEAQSIGRIGSFEWDMAGQGRSRFTPQLYLIFEMEKTSNLDDFLQYVHADDRVKVVTAIEKAIKGEADYDCTYRYCRAGKDKVVWSRGIVLYKDGKPDMMRGTVMDISELAALHTSLQQKNKELERSNQELSAFTYVASHDLQEPLRKIKTFSTRILETDKENLTATAKDYFTRINASATRMQRLIDDLLTLSRTQTRTHHVEPLDLNTLLFEIRNFYKDAIEEKRLVIEASELPQIHAVPIQAQQLFENILGNSIKYARPGIIPQVRISAEKVRGEQIPLKGPEAAKDYHKISFSDNGIGFDQRYAEKIFEVFQRLHGMNQYPGTGIGLSICKRIMENHSGFITAKGKVNEGAVFDVYFPCGNSKS